MDSRKFCVGLVWVISKCVVAIVAVGWRSLYFLVYVYQEEVGTHYQGVIGFPTRRSRKRSAFVAAWLAFWRGSTCAQDRQ